MKTDTKEYHDYLEKKYLPGRGLYLSVFFYPKIFKEFSCDGTIVDLGCGTGEFLNFCKKMGREAIGIDSNESLVKTCATKGHTAIVDDVCKLTALKGKRFNAAICENVLEHLETSEINEFFTRTTQILSSSGTLVCIVPGLNGFRKDPTHKTRVTRELLLPVLEKNNLQLVKQYFHPVNIQMVDSFFYLNMQVFVINKL